MKEDQEIKCAYAKLNERMDETNTKKSTPYWHRSQMCINTQTDRQTFHKNNAHLITMYRKMFVRYVIISSNITRNNSRAQMEKKTTSARAHAHTHNNVQNKQERDN